MKTLLVATLAAEFCAVFAANAVAAAPPSNDNRLAARSVSVPQTVSGTTAGATLEDGEVDLHAGDCVVQRRTNHAWRNRGDTPVRVMAIMFGLEP